MRCVVAGLVGTVTLVLAAGAAEEKIPLDKLPDAVRNAVKDKFAGAELVSATREEENGKTIYEIAVKHDGRKMDVSLTADGKIVEVEKQITAKELPEPVAKALKDRWARATLKRVEEVTRGDKVVYEVAISQARGGRTMRAEITFNAEGKVVNWENPDAKVALSALPKKVVAAFKEKFPGAEMTKAEKEMADGKLIYEISFKRDGKDLEAEFTPEGDFIEVEVTIAVKDLPRAVALALEAKYPKATYRHAAKVTRKDDSQAYEVIVSTADKRTGEVLVSPEGKILEAKGLDNRREN
jgi:uncharacterized membrane protein YkoI